MRIYHNEGEEVCLVNWDVIEPFWLRNTCHPLDRSKLARAYSKLWFTKDAEVEHFIPGGIWFDEGNDCINFINGRNRTNLLLLYTNIVPIGFDVSILDHPILSKAIVEKGAELIEYDLPGLPMWEPSDLLAWD